MEVLPKIKHKTFPFNRNWSPSVQGHPEAIRGTSREKFYHYHVLGFDYFESRRKYRNVCCFYNVFKTQLPRYLFYLFLQPKQPVLQEIMISYLD